MSSVICQQVSDQFLALHAKASNIPPDTFDNNPADQKILSCARALAGMAATKEFQDEPSAPPKRRLHR